MQVNWPTLWMSWRERELREIIVLPIIVLIMLVPVGAFSGAAPTICREDDLALCVLSNTFPLPAVAFMHPPCLGDVDRQTAGCAPFK